MSEIKLWRQMTNRFTRHDYDYGDYWNALDSAIEIIERQQKEIKALKLLLEVKDELLVAYRLGTYTWQPQGHPTPVIWEAKP